MKFLISLTTAALLFMGSANAATDYPRIKPVAHSYSMSGDGRQVFYVSGGPSGPALWDEEVPGMEFQKLSLSGALGRCVLQRPAAVTLFWL